MPTDDYDINIIMEDRRKAVEKNIRKMSAQELKALGEELFPSLEDSWREMYLNFIDENATSTFYHATTQDRIHLVYCRDKGKGIWFIPGSGKGPLQQRGLIIMKEIVDQM
jgi:hypothetical protein